MIVLDASALLELLLFTPVGQQVAARIKDPRLTLHAPTLIDLEILQVLRRYQRLGELDSTRAELALVHLAEIELERYPATPFLSRIWALRQNLTAYDAAYISLAEALEAPLLTFDRKLASSPGHLAVVEVPGSQDRS